MRDAQFVATPNRRTRRYTVPSSPAAGRIDLLTAVLHEMGHALGLPDDYALEARDDVMYGFLTAGERRLPRINQARHAMPGSATHAEFLGLPTSIGNIDAGTTVSYRLRATVNAGFGGGNITNTATISGSNFSNVNTNTTTVPVHVPPSISSGNSTTFEVGSGGSFNVTASRFPGPDFQPHRHSARRRHTDHGRIIERRAGGRQRRDLQHHHHGHQQRRQQHAEFHPHGERSARHHERQSDHLHGRGRTAISSSTRAASRPPPSILPPAPCPLA